MIILGLKKDSLIGMYPHAKSGICDSPFQLVSIGLKLLFKASLLPSISVHFKQLTTEKFWSLLKQSTYPLPKKDIQNRHSSWPHSEQIDYLQKKIDKLLSNIQTVAAKKIFLKHYLKHSYR